MKPTNTIKRGRPRTNGRTKNLSSPSGSLTQEEVGPNYHSHDQKIDNRPRHNNSRNYQQLFDKYTALARDSLTIGDRVTAEFHYQYADHYLRLINEKQMNNSNNGNERDNRWHPRHERGGQRRPHHPHSKQTDTSKSEGAQTEPSTLR